MGSLLERSQIGNPLSLVMCYALLFKQICTTAFEGKLEASKELENIKKTDRVNSTVRLKPASRIFSGALLRNSTHGLDNRAYNSNKTVFHTNLHLKEYLSC